MRVTGEKLTAQNTMANPWAAASLCPHKTMVISMALWKTPRNPGAWGMATVRAMATAVKQAAPKGRSMEKA